MKFMTNFFLFLSFFSFQEGPQLSDSSSDVTTNPLNPNWFSDIYQGLDLDLPSPSNFNFSYRGMEFQEGDDGFFNFAHSYPSF